MKLSDISHSLRMRLNNQRRRMPMKDIDIQKFIDEYNEMEIYYGEAPEEVELTYFDWCEKECDDLYEGE